MLARWLTRLALLAFVHVIGRTGLMNLYMLWARTCVCVFGCAGLFVLEAVELLL